MRLWISEETLRCPNLLARCGDQLVCMLDVFILIFMHSIVEMVSDFHIDVCGLIVSLLVCVDVGPHLPPGHWRQVVTLPLVVASAVAPSGNSHRRQQDMDGLIPYMEEVVTRVSDVGWKHLNTKFIAAIHNLPPELTGVMRKMAVAYEHFRQTARGGLLTEDASSSEDDDAESDDGSESD